MKSDMAVAGALLLCGVIAVYSLAIFLADKNNKIKECEVLIEPYICSMSTSLSSTNEPDYIIGVGSRFKNNFEIEWQNNENNPIYTLTNEFALWTKASNIADQIRKLHPELKVKLASKIDRR